MKTSIVPSKERGGPILGTFEHTAPRTACATACARAEVLKVQGSCRCSGISMYAGIHIAQNNLSIERASIAGMLVNWSPGLEAPNRLDRCRDLLRATRTQIGLCRSPLARVQPPSQGIVPAPSARWGCSHDLPGPARLHKTQAVRQSSSNDVISTQGLEAVRRSETELQCKKTHCERSYTLDRATPAFNRPKEAPSARVRGPSREAAL